MGTTIFYFTGTGNSLMLARDLGAALGDARLISIARAIREPELDLTDECIGFVYPVYFLSMPLIVRDFIKKFSSQGLLDKGKYLFAVAHCGNMPGNALHDLAELIGDQGGEVAAGFHLRLPENYILAFNPPDAPRQEKQFQAAKIKTATIAAVVKARQRNGIEKATFAPLMKLMTPVYQRLTHMATESQRTATIHSSAQSFRVSGHCKGCGVCRAVCPVDNIVLENGRPHWRQECQQCLACINWCPEKAIEFGTKTVHRKRYTNPTVTVKDVIASGGQPIRGGVPIS